MHASSSLGHCSRWHTLTRDAKLEKGRRALESGTVGLLIRLYLGYSRVTMHNAEHQHLYGLSIPSLCTDMTSKKPLRGSPSWC